MRRQRRWSAPTVVALAAALLTAGATGACSDPWPAARPADFTINDRHSAGMLPRYWRLDIKGTDGRYEARRDRAVTKISFKITAAEADALYAVFRRARFDLIAQEQRGRIHDRGGRSISASFGTTYIRKSNSGRSFIAKSSYKEWRAVAGALTRLRTRVLAGHAKP